MVNKKFDYMLSIGAVKTNKYLNIANYIGTCKSFVKTLTKKILKFNNPENFELPIYLIDREEYIDSNKIKNYILEYSDASDYLHKDQDFAFIFAGKNWLVKRELPVKAIYEGPKEGTYHFVIRKKR